MHCCFDFCSFFPQVLPSAESARVAHRLAAVNGSAGFCGFPKLAEGLAKFGSSHTFCDKVSKRRSHHFRLS